MVLFNQKIIQSRFEGLPSFLPFWDVTGSEKQEEILWKEIFQKETNKYFLIGSGNYFHLSGILPESYQGKPPFEKSNEFAHYVLEGIVLFYDNNKDFICGGMFGDYDLEDFLDSEHPVIDYLFKMGNGNLAQTNEDKNILIEKYIKEIVGSN